MILMLHSSLKHILVINLAEDIQQIIRRSLKHNANWQVRSANSLAEGLTLTQTNQPDVILLEASSIDKCDPNVWQQLQTIVASQSIPTIFMADRVRAIDLFKFQQLGGTTAIAKPFDPKDLIETISQVLK